MAVSGPGPNPPKPPNVPMPSLTPAMGATLGRPERSVPPVKTGRGKKVEKDSHRR
jgi:hypothetical protein